MKYIVSIAIDGRVDVEVSNASSPEDAKEQALQKFLDINLGAVECVDFHAVNATDENDELTDF